jgi:hypothetical protein
MPAERKLYLLDLGFDTMRDREEANFQLSKLEDLLNSGWDITQTIPLGSVGGITSVSSGSSGPSEAMQFARSFAIIVLEKKG